MSVSYKINLIGIFSVMTLKKYKFLSTHRKDEVKNNEHHS